MVFSRFFLLVLAMPFISSCAFDNISPQDPTAFIPDRSSEIKVGQMTREGVRGVLGNPFLSSTYWDFDLFRAETEQTDVPYAITPWPIPFARIKDKLYRYTLVTYDTKGLTSAIATGIFRRPTDWRSASPIKHDFQALHLRAGELMFYTDFFALQENMLVTPTARDNFLQLAPSSAGCLVVIGCGDRGCGDQLAVDGSKVRRLPMRLSVDSFSFFEGSSRRLAWLKGVGGSIHESNDGLPPSSLRNYSLQTLVAVKLPVGEHDLEFSSKYLDGKHSIKVACHPGELTYLMVSASVHEHLITHSLVDWQIEQTDNMPESFENRPLVLLYDGEWYVDVEPGRGLQHQ